MENYKNPNSVLVVIHNESGEILLLERTQAVRGFWQSVTGSLEKNETPETCALREVAEETGFCANLKNLKPWHQKNRFRIFSCYQKRYAPGVLENTEYVFSLQIPKATKIALNPLEHLTFQWLPWQRAARLAFSPSNRDAILYWARIFKDNGAFYAPFSKAAFLWKSPYF